MKRSAWMIAIIVLFTLSGATVQAITGAREIVVQFITPLLLDGAGLTYPDCSNGDCFTVAVLPDTQFYSNYECKESDYDEWWCKWKVEQTTYEKQAQWIVDNENGMNIKFVLHVGDITDQNSSREWRRADEAHNIFDINSVPFSIVQGNHDFQEHLTMPYGRQSKFNDYFGPTQRKFNDNLLYPNRTSWPDLSSENSVTFFEVDDLKFMVIGLEFAPRKDALCWAEKLIKDNPDRRVIVVTHCYQQDGGDWCQDCSDRLVGSSGDDLWYEFLRRHSNIFMVLSGHKTDSEFNPRRRSYDNNTVYEILTDYVDEKKDDQQHGQGWLRIFTFYPKKDRVETMAISVTSDNRRFTARYDEPPYDRRYPEDPKEFPHSVSIPGITPGYFIIPPYTMTQSFPGKTYTPLSYEFSDRAVNPESEDDGNQEKPVIAMGPDGRFVAAWEDKQDNTIKIRSFKKGGCPCTPNGIEETTLPGGEVLSQSIVVSEGGINPGIAMANNGNIVVTWQQLEGTEHRIFANIYQQVEVTNINGDIIEKLEIIVENVPIDSEGVGSQQHPNVDVDSRGNFVVVWENYYNTSEPYDILAAGLSAVGVRLWDDNVAVAVAVKSFGQPAMSALLNKTSTAMFADGSFTVVWQDESEDQYFHIYAAIFSPEGNVVKDTFAVDGRTGSNQINPAAAAGNSGLVITWEDYHSLFSQIFAAGFDRSGEQNSWGNILIKRVQLSPGMLANPDLAAFSDGSFITVWQDEDLVIDGFYQIFAALFNSDGTRRQNPEGTEKEFTVNKIGTGQQLLPVVSSNPTGFHVIAWQDDANDNNEYDVVTRGFELVDIDPPVITCPVIKTGNDEGQCGAVVIYPSPAAFDNRGAVKIELTDGLGSGAFFPVGTTLETYIATDASGNTDSCSIAVTVIDTEPPEIILSKEKTTLWPPNHKPHAVDIGEYIASVDDNCPGVSVEDVVIDKVSSDEELNGTGDGNTENDITISADCRTTYVLSERKGNGNGRVYTAGLAVADDHGNIGTAEIVAEVPHDMGNTSEVIDDGPAYFVNGCDL